MNLINDENLRWKRFATEEFGYPIDYSAALLSARDDGHVDLLYRWEPNCYCHFHRHTARTTSTVLAGELHVIDVDPESGREIASKVRRAGDYACKDPGDVHMERGGSQGALVLFNLFSPTGVLAESLAQDGSVIGVSTLEQILKGRASR